MDCAVSIPMLKRKLDVLLARDVSSMGYEAKVRHRHRLETARSVYKAAMNDARKPQPKSPIGR